MNCQALTIPSSTGAGVYTPDESSGAQIPLLDDQGNPILDDQGDPIYIVL